MEKTTVFYDGDKIVSEAFYRMRLDFDKICFGMSYEQINEDGSKRRLDPLTIKHSFVAKKDK